VEFDLTRQQVELKEHAIRFAAEALNEGVIERDRDAVLFRPLVKRCGEFGMQGSAFPARYGGRGLDIVSTVAMMEGLGYGCRDAGLIFGLNGQMWSVQMPLLEFGTDEQKDRYLRGLCQGDLIAANAMTEPESGSDAFSLTTSATLRGDQYVLTGVKTFSTMAPDADVFLVYATVDPANGFFGITAFLVDRGTPGITIGPPIGKMGLRTAPFAELRLENCSVPVTNRLGREGNGAAIFESSIEWERACILAGVLGAMARQLEQCIAHSRQRKQFGKAIGKNQSIANKIVDMKVRLETARLLLYKAAWTKHARGKAALDAAIAKLYISESWIKSSLDAVQIHGGYGYTTAYEVERDLRDSIGGTLYSGTSEIQRNIIARLLGL
jgi:alkylation response protein AidB-like acyl-CoA dehydrogenase